MLHGITANKATFHPVTFEKGLNVIVAEMRDASDKKETRNGLGKSTLIEIIDFCLGSSLQKGQGLALDLLNEWAFTLDLTIAGKRIKATRSIASPTRIVIEGDTHGWIKHPEVDDRTGELIFHIDDWKKVLGWGFFKLETVETTERYKPSYRVLVSYFLRSGADAYIDPFINFRNQNAGNIQLNIAYLIGLNWQHAAKWQSLKDKEDAVRAVEKAVDFGLRENAGALEAERITLEESLLRGRKELSSFRVHAQYADIEVKVNQLTEKIHEKTNDNILDKRKLKFYKDASANENTPEVQRLEEVYKQSGFLFPSQVKKSLLEVRNFHDQVVKNRKEFLELEIFRLKEAITSREEEVKVLTAERAVSLDVLNTHGAFEEYALLQDNHTSTQQKLENLKLKISEVRNISSQKKLVKSERIELTKVAEIDYDERRPAWEKAVRLFNEYSQALYKAPGKFVINISETGYKFKVDIERSQSEGIGKMKLFCFDLMLAKLWTGDYKGINFLVHDSIMFDGVDARQRALALELVAETASESNFQYICTLNSDMVPTNDFSEDFEFDDYVRLRLKDGDASGSLLGIRF